MLSQEEYVKSSGTKCPHCSSANVYTTGNLEVNYNMAVQPVKCRSCDKEWTDEYTLTGFSAE